jgi:hypothetical protein
MALSFLTHATGLAALGLNLSGLVRRCDVKLRKSQGLSSLLWALNNFLLGASCAAALSVVSAGRTAAVELSDQRGARTRRLACLGFVALSIAIGAATWRGWPTLLTMTASAVTSYAIFYVSGARLRLVMLASGVLWSYHAWSLHSLEQIAANTLAIAAAAVGAWRTRRGAWKASANPGSFRRDPEPGS